MPAVTLIDTHSHLYPVYNPREFIENAWRNLDALSPGSDKAIVLTERPSESYFDRMRSHGHIGRLSVHATEEPESLVIDLSEGRSLTIFVGRQYNSLDGLEVLSLGARLFIAEPLPAATLLEQIHLAGGIAVLPWSFGKWAGKRNRLVNELLARSDLAFALGDIVGRSALLSAEEIFLRADAQRRPVLYGSDPLPFARDADCVGTLATVVPCPLDRRRPWASIAGALTKLTNKTGRHNSVGESLRRQCALRFSLKL